MVGITNKVFMIDFTTGLLSQLEWTSHDGRFRWPLTSAHSITNERIRKVSAETLRIRSLVIECADVSGHRNRPSCDVHSS